MTPTTRGRFCHVANRAEMGTILLTSCHVYYPRGRLTETLKVQEAGWTEHVEQPRRRSEAAPGGSGVDDCEESFKEQRRNNS